MVGTTTVDLSAMCRKGADVVFVVDRSSNLLYEDFRSLILGTIVEIIRRLPVDSGRTRVAAVLVTNTAKVRLRVSTNYFLCPRSGPTV